jgi:lambda family phage minor tail protein L
MSTISLIGLATTAFGLTGSLFQNPVQELKGAAIAKFTVPSVELSSPKTLSGSTYARFGIVKAAASGVVSLVGSTSVIFVAGKDNFTQRDLAEFNQNAELDDFIVLFEIDTTILGGEVYRFTSSSKSSSAVKFGNNIYTPIDVDADGWEWNGSGQAPTPKLRIGNTTKLLTGLVNQYQDLLGATVTRIRTWARYLSDGNSPDSTSIFPRDVYRIERKATENKFFVEFELANAIDQSGKQLNARQILRDICTHRYRSWDPVTLQFIYTNVTCPYHGGASFNAQGVPCPTSQDMCGKLLSDCVARFGNNELPTRAFPGVARVRIN